jgi:predicted lipoprotein with Yx(FWY)xxD motif
MKLQTRAGGPVAARRARYAVVSLLAASAGIAAAALTGLASAKSPTAIDIAKNVPVKSHRQSVAVDAQGITVYTLSGESVRHLKCTKANTCFKFWFPLKTASARTKLRAATGIKGKLGTLHRNGFYQVTLAGHPLYTFIGDANKKRSATGEGIVSFGGTWHVIAVKSASGTGTNPSTTTTTSTVPYAY